MTIKSFFFFGERCADTNFEKVIITEYYYCLFVWLVGWVGLSVINCGGRIILLRIPIVCDSVSKVCMYIQVVECL